MMNNPTFKFLSFFIVCSVLIVTTSSRCKTEPKTFPEQGIEKGFVVMELFTSQGCSSCPPADNLLAKYAAKNDSRIIPLAFHVDYWNRLGWTDSFSSAKYSDRQREYAMSIDNSSVYTPQLIINGTKEFVGSDEGKIAAAVGNALKEEPLMSILTGKALGFGNRISVSYKIDKLINNTTLRAALVQKQSFTNILRGENRRLKLVNYNVVRDFISIQNDKMNSTVELHLPAGYNENDFTVVLYVQQNSSGKILGATKINL